MAGGVSVQEEGKTPRELAHEAIRFLAHTVLAVALLLLGIVAFSLAHPEVDSVRPKLIGTALAIVLPLLGGLLVMRRWRDPVAPYVWISGLLLFSVVSVAVLDLPTGVGLCERCGASEKLTRTFFAVENGSGLLGGDGLLIGTWIPLSMVGYALGAQLMGRRRPKLRTA